MQAHQTRASTDTSGQRDASATSGRTSEGHGNAYASERTASAATGQDPAGYPDGAGNGSVHAPVSAGDAVNAGTAAPSVEAGERDVQVFHDAGDPLRMAATPDEGTLFEARPATGTCDAGWESVRRVVGSVDAPSQVKLVDERSVYIGGAPSPDDVQQGGLADCYFLATLASVAQSDPGQIQGMIRHAGNGVTVTFHRYDDASSTWVPCTVSVTTDLAQRSDGNGGTAGLLGAGFRLGEAPTESEWHADVLGEDLWIGEDAYYEAGLWAPLMEKAYARYVERFGQYGGFDTASANAATDAAGNALSGYQVFEGGIADYVYPILYGPDVVAADMTDVSYTPGGDLVAENLDAIRNLLRLSGDGVAADQAFHMTAGIDRDDAVERLDAQLAHVLEKDDVKRYPTFERELRHVRDLAAAWRGAPDAGKENARSRVGDAAQRMAAPGAWPILESSRGDGEYRDLSDLLLVVANIGTDGAGGQRLTYAWHSYSVLGAEFSDATGAALDVTQANLDAQKASLDPARSRVRLRNPHGTNEPDRDGSGRTEGANDGNFSLSLEQFFRVFSYQQHGLVKR